jgi:hypothetical protein
MLLKFDNLDFFSYKSTVCVSIQVESFETRFEHIFRQVLNCRMGGAV